MTTPSGVALSLNMGQPATSNEIPIILSARGAWYMRLENNATPSGSWQAYNPYFMHSLPLSTGVHWVVAEVKDDNNSSAPLVSGQVSYYHTSGINMSLTVDSCVFLAVSGILSSSGFRDLDDNLTVNLHNGSIESFIPFEYEEDTSGGFDASNLSQLLPAVCVDSDSDDYSPAALGGENWESRKYIIEIMGEDSPQAREIASSISEKLLRGVDIYDFNLGFPGNPGFPLPNQLIGSFPIRNLKDRKVLLPLYGSIHEHRRRITFEVLNIRKAF